MADFSKSSADSNHDVDSERDKRKLQDQQEQYQQLQRDLADAISRLASLDDIRILLACGAKANNVVTQGLRPLHYAAYTNFVPAVRVSLSSSVSYNSAVQVILYRMYCLMTNDLESLFSKQQQQQLGANDDKINSCYF